MNLPQQSTCWSSKTSRTSPPSCGRFWQEQDYTATTAFSCEDALAQVRKRRPDVITLDMKMPRRSGVFFYRKLKADEALRGVPVVVVTALTRNDKDMENVIRSFLEAENVPRPQAYLEKPVDGPSFLRTIQEAIDKSGCSAGNQGNPVDRDCLGRP